MTTRRSPALTRASVRSFWCFISYRHADNRELGRQWATWLHHAIETYEVPTDLVGTLNGRGETIPARIFPVFRDEEELPADADLASPVYRALEESKYLLVICSPRSVGSQYVANEIRFYKKLGREERVLAAIIDGEPNACWDVGKQACGFRPEQECFPEPLRHRVDAEGRLLEDRTEPIAADFRLDDGSQGWTTPEAYRHALSANVRLSAQAKSAVVEAYRKKCELMKLKIIAGILGVALGTLTKRDAVYQLAQAQRSARVRSVVLAVVSVLAVAAIIAAALAYRAQQQTLAEKRHATETLARSDFLQAESLIKQDRIADALPYLARSLRTQLKNNPAGALAFGYLPGYARPSGIFQHHPRATAANFNHRGDNIVVTFDNGSAGIWSLSSGEFTASSFWAGKPVPDSIKGTPGAPMAYAVDDDNVRAWRSISYPEGVCLPHGGAVTSAIFSPDGRLVATASADFTAAIWEARTGKPLGHLQHRDVVNYINFSADSHRVVTDSMNGTARVWDANTLQPVGPSILHQGIIRSANFSPDGARIVTASDDHTARVWDARTGRPITPALDCSGIVNSAQFSPDGRSVVTTSEDGAITVWDAVTGRMVSASRTEEKEGIVSARFSGDGNHLVEVSQDGTAQLLDVGANAATAQLVKSSDTIYLKRAGSEETGLVRASAESLAAWNADPSHADALNLPAFAFHSVMAQFSPDDRRVATALGYHGAHVWDVGSGRVITPRFQHDGPIRTVNFSPDGTRIITASDDHTARIWDLAPEGDCPEWLPDVIEACAFQYFEETGSPSLETPENFNCIRAKRLVSTSNAPWEVFGRWLFSDPQTRTISPWSSVTVPGYVQQMIAAETRESLDEAAKLSPGDPNVQKQIDAKRVALPKQRH